MTIEEQVRAIARRLGFDECRLAKAEPAAHAREFQDWLDAGEHGDMAWMEKAPERRKDPRKLVEGAKTVIVLALNYCPAEAGGDRSSEIGDRVGQALVGRSPGGADRQGPSAKGQEPQAGGDRSSEIGDRVGQALVGRSSGGAKSQEPSAKGQLGRFARYAWGEDYHLVIDKKLKAFARELRELGGDQRFYVDYGPVLERDVASAAGLGWNGKSTVQIHPELGTWFFLAELVTTLELTPDRPMPDRCGKCTACIDICPTDAITAVRHVDARRCISYLTIEHLGAIPEEFREAMGDRVFGCDDCLEVCPWNRFARASREAKFAARDFIDIPLREFLAMDDEAFRAAFARSPVKRTGRERLLRNVCVALGNVGTADDLPALERAAETEGELVAEHARWASAQIASRFAP